MTVFQIHAKLEKYKSFYPVSDEPNLELQLSGYLKFKGKPKHDWNGVRVYLKEIYDDIKVEFPVADITRSNNAALAYSEKAVEVLRNILEESGELLMFEHEEKKWYVHNILNTFAALDYEKSKYEFSDENKFERTHEVIDKSKLNNISLFKLKEDNYAINYCKVLEDKSRDFKYQVEKNGLTGLVFLFGE